MYLWKCWLDYGKFALGTLALLVSLACWGDRVQLSRLSFVQVQGKKVLKCDSGDRGQTFQEWMEECRRQENVWQSICQLNVDLIVFAGWLAAVFIGSKGSIAAEFSDKTTDLLFTRPRTRRSLVWANWLCGLLMLEAILAITVVLSTALCRPYFGPWANFQLIHLFKVILAMLPINMMIFGIATLAGVLFRGATRGTLAAAIAVGVYFVCMVFLKNYYGLNTPDWWFDRLFEATVINGGDLTRWNVLLIWVSVPLIFPYASQKLLQQRDIS